MRPPEELRFKIPEKVRSMLAAEPYVVIKYSPIGLWPVDPGMLRRIEGLRDLLADKAFTDNFEIVIMPKAQVRTR